MEQDRWFKTTRGEVYEKCGIRFGPEPTRVSVEELHRETPRAGMDRSIGDWLFSDKRLIEVPCPYAKPESADSAVNESERTEKAKKIK